MRRWDIVLDVAWGAVFVAASAAMVLVAYVVGRVL